MINLLQFPFRFFVPATILILVGLCLLVPYYRGKPLANPRWFVLVLVLSVGQILIQNTVKMQDWHSDEAAVSLRNHTYLSAESEAQLKEAYFSKDKSLALALYQRSTPDYLPLYQETKKNKYNLYGEEIIEKNDTVAKTVENGKLTLRWQGDQEAWKALPIINYRYTELTLNQQPLTEKDVSLSAIGAVSVQQQAGENVLVVDYDAPWFFDGALWLTIISWLALLIGFISWKTRQLYRRRKVVQALLKESE